MTRHPISRRPPRSAWLLAAAAGLGLAGSAAAGEASFAPDPNGATTFTMPSGNVECIYVPAGGTKVYRPADGGPELSCDRLAPSYVRVTLGRAGAVKRFDNPGDASCCGADNPLAYGDTWAAGPFSCTSQSSGLTCSRSDGRGFAISRAAIRVR